MSEKEESPEGYLFGKIPYYRNPPMTFGRGIGIAIMAAGIVLAREYFS